ncbi:MFS transporter [Alicyclobacillus fodiniaquatilis]|uniref:MFS transporter n=1 Tax=Alicyclobacillus fodiniaquatilis TaxID=1661150 RepID=A0ABW4JEV9_9BACL
MMTQQAFRRLTHYFPLPILTNRQHYHWLIVCTVSIGAFMAALDASIINITLVNLEHSFQVSMATIEWVSLIYLLTLAALIVPFGSLSDILGRRPMYTCGFLVFIIGSFLCAISPSLGALLCFRVIQGAGAAMLQANSVSIITAASPSCVRGKAIGIQAFAQGLGLSVGPLAGGFFIDHASWHTIFMINVPIGIFGILMALMILPCSTSREKRAHFDGLGALLLACALVSIMYLLKEGTNNIGLLGGGLLVIVIILLLLGFFFWERKAKRPPLVQIAYLAKREIWLGNLTGILSFSAMYAVTLLGPFWLIHERGFSSLTAGLYLCAVPIGMAICTPLAGALADHVPARQLTMAGMMLVFLGALCLAAAPTSLFVFLLGLFLVGCGLGTFTPPNNAKVMEATAVAHLGVAGSILNMSRTIGMGLGVTIGGVTYDLFVQMFGAQHLISAFRASFLVAAIIALLTVIILLCNRPSAAHQDTQKTA